MLSGQQTFGFWSVFYFSQSQWRHSALRTINGGICWGLVLRLRVFTQLLLFGYHWILNNPGLNDNLRFLDLLNINVSLKEQPRHVSNPGFYRQIHLSTFENCKKMIFIDRKNQSAMPETNQRRILGVLSEDLYCCVLRAANWTTYAENSFSLTYHSHSKCFVWLSYVSPISWP